MKKNKNILFIGDPWETLDHENDSTLYLAEVAEKHFKATCWYTELDKVSVDQGELFFEMTGKLSKRELNPTGKNEREKLFRDFDSIHWRVDPPVTLDQHLFWSLVTNLNLGKTKFLNNPLALLSWNEKFSALRYPRWSKPTYVSSSLHRTSNLLREVAFPEWIIKSVNNAASRGVFHLKLADTMENQILSKPELLSSVFHIAQPYDKKVQTAGETRLFVIAGKIEGCLKKKLPKGERISLLDVEKKRKAKLEIGIPSSAQLKRAKKIAVDLLKSGVHLATIDFIGSEILEINVTSPGLLKWHDEQMPPTKSLAMKYWKRII